MAAIFLSHASRDDALASAIEAWLKANHFDDLFVDHDSIRAGDKWAEELRRAKGSCRVVLCLVTPHWLESDECYGEFKACWYLGRRIIPLLTQTTTALSEKQRGRLDRVLAEDQGINFGVIENAATFDIDAQPRIAELLQGGLRAAGAVSKIGLDPAAFDIDSKIQPEPFPGLESFGDTDADAAIFYGRSPEIAQTLEDLREMRATGDRRAYAIQGASGSGKSSLLKAGILPRLRRERGWFVVRTFRPGGDPLYNFADAIARTASALGLHVTPGALRDRLLAAKQSGANFRNTLDAVMAPLKDQADRSGATVLISMDQGEELARTTGEGAETLSAYLRAALEEPEKDKPGSYLLTLTVRSDSFHDLQQSPCFEGIAVRAADVRTLPVFRFGAAIEQPAARYRVEIEPALIDALMDDASGKDALPLLAFTLQRLWRQYAKEGRIRKADYNSFGKLSGLIADAAERALRNVDPLAPQGSLEGKVSDTRNKHAAHVFVPALAQVNDRGAAIRRVAHLSAFDDDDKTLLESFAKWRLVVMSADLVEVAHEAMFREWPRCREWLALERERLETLSSVESAAASWASKGRKPEDLTHRGKRLAEARALMKVPGYKIHLDRNSEASTYLESCIGSQRRNRIRVGMGAVAVALLALLIVSIPAIVNHFKEVAAARKHHEAVMAAENYTPKSPIIADEKTVAQLPKGSVFRDCSDCPEMVVIGAGSFVMGSSAKEADSSRDETPQHRVMVPKFAMGRFDVTFDDWDACVRGGGCASIETPSDYNAGRGRRPQIAVSWQDAHAYAMWLSQHTKQSYRLPSEAEWEYATRANGADNQVYYTGSSIDHTQANFDNANGAVEPVGSYPPNPFGLYDMVGNAWQWVEDCYNISYTGAPSDGSAWTMGNCTLHIIRGGSWYNDITNLRSAKRNSARPFDRPAHGGFRVVREIAPS